MSSLTVNTWQVKAKTFIFCLIFIFRYQAKMFSVYSKKKRKWQSSTLWSNCFFQFTYVLRSIIRALPVTVLKHPDFYLKTWLSVEIVLFCACEKYVHFHTCLWKTKADETRQIPLFCFFSPLMYNRSDTHLLHWADRISQFTILDRNTLFPLVHHVVDFFKLLLTTLLCVQ